MSEAEGKKEEALRYGKAEGMKARGLVFSSA
jgi:hypothetical protein